MSCTASTTPVPLVPERFATLLSNWIVVPQNLMVKHSTTHRTNQVARFNSKNCMANTLSSAEYTLLHVASYSDPCCRSCQHGEQQALCKQVSDSSVAILAKSCLVCSTDKMENCRTNNKDLNLNHKMKICKNTDLFTLCFPKELGGTVGLNLIQLLTQTDPKRSVSDPPPTTTPTATN